MIKRSKGLLFKFAAIFSLFIIVTLTLTGVATYRNQMSVYRTQKLENLQLVSEHLANILTNSGIDFLQLQDYYVKNREKFLVPHNLSSSEDSLESYERMFTAKYPGKILGKGIDFSQLDEETKLAYALYNYEFFLLSFENICKTFQLAYTYYLIPDEEPEHIFYMFDGVRKSKSIDGRDYILVARKALVERAKHPFLWEAWETGRRPDNFGVWDNDFGHNYSCYYPLIINGEKLGIIGAEVEVADANREILRNSIRQTGVVGLILIFTMALLLLSINRFYISRMIELQADVKEYAELKNPDIAERIKNGILGEDEIASLAMQISSMIHELEDYMNNLLATTKELHATQKNAALMNMLAYKDSLTGVRNKTAYDNEVQRLESNLSSGEARFGIGMIDLNFLKKINDTYGHNHGNEAIKKLCLIVCKIFAHSPVFRIGGDEFVIIFQNSDYENIDSLIASFKEQLEASKRCENEWERVSAAIGIAFYDSSLDKNVESVFKRADMNMYENKKAMKAMRED